MNSVICDMFGIEFPLLAFSHCRNVVVEVSKAGGMGVLGTTRLDPEQLEQELRWIDDHTDGRPYGLDLALPNKMEKARPMAERATALPEEHIRFVDRLLEKANIPPLPAHERAALYKETPGFRLTAEGGRELIDVALRHPKVKLVVSALGVAPRDMVDRLHANGIRVGALVGSVEHARRQQAAGMDILVAQGMEAGAHTGNIASMVLWPQVVDAVAPLPVLAAGGVGRGRQIAAALALGAEGVWCGSIWLGTRESELSPEMKQRFFAAGSEDAVQRRVLTGKQCRMLRSAFTEAWNEPGAPQPLPMPLQSMLVGEARVRIERARNKDYMTYYVGQIVGDMREETSVRGVIRDMLEELADTYERFERQLGGAA